jgi:hypothetical protein
LPGFFGRAGGEPLGTGPLTRIRIWIWNLIFHVRLRALRFQNHNAPTPTHGQRSTATAMVGMSERTKGNQQKPNQSHDVWYIA